MTWRGSFWEGMLCLNAWRGFTQTGDRRWWSMLRGPANKDLLLQVSSPVENGPQPPSAEQLTSFQHLLSHQEAIRDAVLEAVFADYLRLRECYGDAVDGQSMPPISQASGLLRLLSPNIVHVLANPKDGFTRVGFGFDCKWDEEHGLGVLTHRGAVIATGGADEAFNEYFPDLERGE